MDEGPESGDPCSWPNHDDRSLFIFRKIHSALLEPDRNRILMLFDLLLEPVRANAFLLSLEFGLIFSYSHGEMRLFWMQIKARTNTELSWLLPSTKLDQILKRQLDFLIWIKIIKDFNYSPSLSDTIPVVLGLAFNSLGGKLSQLLLVNIAVHKETQDVHEIP